MKFLKKESIYFVCLIVFVLPHLLMALEPTHIKDIKELKDKIHDYKEDTVLVKGEVDHYIEKTTKHSKCYTLKGDYGETIDIITSNELPIRHLRYVIKGIVIINDQEKSIIIEQERREINPRAPDDIETNNKNEKEGDQVGGQPRDDVMIYYLIGAAVLLLIVIITLVVVMTSTNKKLPYITTPIQGMSHMSSHEFPAYEPKILETPTIKIAAPPPGTLKLLPGHLEVVGGDDSLREIRFYKLKNQEEPEITFGRRSGPNYTHVQLKPMTVSSKQAKIIYTNKKYVLINYATVNPTSVNGAPLSKDGSVSLEEGSKIEMGEVAFIFHEK